MRPKRSSDAYFTHLPTNRIKANALNPRKSFEPASLQELAASLSSHGVLQPLIVYQEGRSFVVICGERRLRAARIAKLPAVPAIVHPVPPRNETVLSMMLIENLQRREVDVVGESAAIKRLVEEHNWSLTDVSKNLGTSLGFTRSRYLLTKFSDVLEAFTEGKISYSEAVELASIDDDEVRKWFFARLDSGELEDFKKLGIAISRDKFLRSQLEEGTLLQRPLDRSAVVFDVEGLPYCDSQCTSFVRITWDEKRHYKLPHEKPGWAEFCSDRCGDCYRKKVEAKRARDEELRRLEFKRPIAEDNLTSMAWFVYRGASCRTCKWMVELSDLEEADCGPAQKKAHAFCSCSDSACFDERTQAFFADRQRREEHVFQDAERRQTALLDELAKATTTNGPSPRRQMTKRECVYVLLQMMCHIGGVKRLHDLAQRKEWLENFPAQPDSQITFLKNKMIDEMRESDLYDLFIQEAFLNSAFSNEVFPPTRFDRDTQTEIRIKFEAGI